MKQYEVTYRLNFKLCKVFPKNNNILPNKIYASNHKTLTIKKTKSKQKNLKTKLICVWHSNKVKIKPENIKSDLHDHFHKYLNLKIIRILNWAFFLISQINSIQILNWIRTKFQIKQNRYRIVRFVSKKNIKIDKSHQILIYI